jgi:hypothetical protein
MQQNAGLLSQHVSSTSMLIFRSTIVSSIFWCPNLEAVWVVYSWAVRCVNCSEDVACWATSSVQHTAVHSSTQQYTAVHSSTQQYTAAHSSTQQHTAVHTSKSPELHNPDGFPGLDTRKRNSLLYS